MKSLINESNVYFLPMGSMVTFHILTVDIKMREILMFKINLLPIF